jgi:hypothetical protein
LLVLISLKMLLAFLMCMCRDTKKWKNNFFQN